MKNRINDYVKNSKILYFCKTDLEGKYTYISPYFEEVFDYIKEDLYGTNSLDTIYIDDHQKTRDIAKKCFENPQTYQSVVLRKPLKTGQVIFTQWEFYLDVDEDNSPKEMLCYGYDIARKVENIELLKIAHNKLEANIIKYKSLFETSSLAIILQTVDGKIYDANQNFCDMVGTDKDTVTEKNLYDFTPIEYWESDKAYLKKLLTYKTDLSYEKEFIRNDKCLVPVSVNHRVFHDQYGKIFIWNIAKDISETKKQSDRLKNQKEFLEQTAHIAKLGGWDLNLETLKTEWTKEVFEIHDVEVDFEPNLSNALEFYNPEDRKKLSKAIRKTINKGEKFDIELKLLSAKNIQKWVRVAGEAVYIDKKMFCVKGIIQDITEKKKDEETILKHIDLLKDISYTQSHIVRLPIANIIGLTDLLKITSSEIEKEEIYEKIGISIKKLDLIITELANKKITD